MVDFQRPRLVELKASIAATIPCERGMRADLESMSLPQLLIRYIGWRDRFVPQRPRKVVTWGRFLNDPRSVACWDGVLQMRERVAAGENLTPFLSKDITKFGYVRPKVEKDGKHRGVEWRDKDYALNAHGVHHLHLSDKIRSNGWSRRTEELLYVSFDRASAFFIMVGDHNSFDDGTLAQAVAEMRAAAGDEIKGLMPDASTPEARNRLQRRGMTTVVPVGDKIVIGAFLSAAGTSLYHTRHAAAIMRKIEAHELLLDQEGYTRPWFKSVGLS
jgi:hypothetical protein